MIRLARQVMLLVVVGLGAVWPGTVMAQAPTEVEVEPIKCWWDVDKHVVRMGEQFALTITCAVVETSRNKAVPAPNQFEPTSVQVAPFEVLNGTRHEDIVAPPYRYFQYLYTLRLMADRNFGQDVDIPSIKIVYHVQFTSGRGSGSGQGRDLTYVLPAIPIRIASLVPRQATDIREPPRPTFREIEARRFRATGEFVAAAICFGFAVVLAGLALVRFVSQRRKGTVTVAPPVAPRLVVQAALRALADVRRRVGAGGWTNEAASRALAALRLAAAVALGLPVAEQAASKDDPEREGQLAVTSGIWKRKRLLVSASTTAAILDAQLAQGNARGNQVQTLAPLREALRLLGSTRYAKGGSFDQAALSRAVDDAIEAIRRLRMKTLWRRPSASRTVVPTAASL